MRGKSILYMVLITLIISSLLGCSTIEDNTNSNYINLISLEEVIDKVDNKDSFNFILGNDGCPACVTYKEELKKLYDKEGYKFDYMAYGPEINQELFFELITEVLGENPQNVATPTTYFIVDGKVDEKIVGAIRAEDIGLYDKYLEVN